MATEKIELLADERWWGGVADAGMEMPFRAGASYDLADNYGNQTAPFLLSSAGRFLWSEKRFRFHFTADALVVEGEGPFEVVSGGSTLKEGFRAASRRHFPPQGKIPDPLLFTAPQYNTWIELTHFQEQKAILTYARNLLKNGYPPGVLMIDAGWMNYWGDWEFDSRTFPDPKKMVQELHRMGFKVMLWVVHFLSPDSRLFRQLRNTNVLVRDAAGKIAIREWWDGHSAMVDVTGGEGLAWFRKQLDRLQKVYGIDGFKFDGADFLFFRDDDRLAVPTDANGHSEAWARLGLRYRLNEYRACWKGGGQPLVQRLRDKTHSWDAAGMASLIPNTLAQGLLGHPFVCPDMIGGGEYLNFQANSDKLEPELFVRYAQASALLPMMQFSAAPWRVLDKRHAKLCVEAAQLHVRFGKKIIALARESARTGDPIARTLAYEFPGHGYENITDQFLLGGEILVAPVLTKGATRRTVRIPPGTWKAEDGKKYDGPSLVEIEAPLERLPYFIKQKAGLPKHK